MLKVLYFFVVCSTFFNILKSEETKDPPIKLTLFFDEIKRIDSDEGKYFEEKVEIKKIGDYLFMINGEIEQFIELNDDNQVQLCFGVADPGSFESYDNIFNTSRIPVCEFMKKYYPYLHTILNAYSDIPPPDTCPLPVRKYTIKEAPFDVDFLRPILKEGRYRVTITIYKTAKNVVEYQLLGHAEKV